MTLKSPQDGTEALKEPDIAIAVTSIAAVVAAKKSTSTPKSRGKANVSRKLPNSSRRKGPVKGTRGLQAPDRREVRAGILYHEPGRKGCRDISLRGMAADRGEASEALQFQPGQEEFPEAHQLLRPGGRTGCAGTVADAAAVAGGSRPDGRSSGDGISEPPRSPED